MRRWTNTSRRSALLRWLAVGVLALSTPSVRLLVDGLVEWATGAEGCCSDGCDDTGAPCSEDCVRCASAHRLATTASPSPVRLSLPMVALASTPASAVAPRTGAGEPPFRPPVS